MRLAASSSKLAGAGRGRGRLTQLDEGFLAVADRVTICPAVDAAVNLGVGGLR